MNWKHWLRYPLDIRVAREALRADGDRSALPADAAVLGLDLASDRLLIDCGRHLACIAAHALRCGCRVVVRCDDVLLAAIAHKRLGRAFLSMPHVSHLAVGDAFPDDSVVLIDDDPARRRRCFAAQRVVRMLLGRDCAANTPVMPYPMYPSQIRSLDAEALKRHRQTSKAGIFFAGNQKPRYGRDAMRRKFGLLSRLEIVETLRAGFPDRIVAREADRGRDRMVLRATDRDPIAAEDWMPTLARQQFFVCCPGASQPTCHNVIEAMSVGAIPVLEYFDRFTPPLREGVNAICFRGRRGLLDAIDRIDAMDDQERRRLGAAVCEHYDRHLCGTRFLQTLMRQARQGLVDAVSMPFHDRNLFDGWRIAGRPGPGGSERRVA
jgi:hypothetical protein